jgi:hypothetical protein
VHTLDIVFREGRWCVLECYPHALPFTAYDASSFEDAVDYVFMRTGKPVVLATAHFV